ncbi:MAG TPA: helix-turn-helix-type transcriptional regulator, partial [Saprospiraceae bacterium]|nr:helix-turn-helix-type transcriptional regulator [Saprospiraceae bacterium]
KSRGFAINQSEVDEVFEDQIDGLMLAMIELNEYKFLKIINHYIEVRGFEKTMSEVLYPFLDKLSIMWVTGSVRGVHESFVTSIIQRKLCYEIDRLASEPKDVMKRFLIYLPENEGHELSLLFLYYILRSRGANVLFLGSNTPLAEVLDGYQIFNPDFIFTLINDSFADIPLQPYLDKLAVAAPNAMIGISGYQTMTQALTPSQNVKVFSSLHEIVTFIEENICTK